MISTGVLALTLLAAPAAVEGPPVVLENRHLRVEFSSKDGAITRLRNKPKGLELVTALPKSRRPWAHLILMPARFLWLMYSFNRMQIFPKTRFVIE